MKEQGTYKKTKTNLVDKKKVPTSRREYTIFVKKFKIQGFLRIKDKQNGR